MPVDRITATLTRRTKHHDRGRMALRLLDALGRISTHDRRA